MPEFKDKLEQAASIAAIVFSVALREAIKEDVPERIKEIFTDEVANRIGNSMAQNLTGYFSGEILDEVIDAGDKKVDELYPKFEEFLNKKIPEMISLVRENISGLGVEYKLPWWARWIGLPQKVMIR